MKNRIATWKWLWGLLLVLMVCVPMQALGQGSLLKGDLVTETGTIQGLLHACAGETCVPGTENMVAAAEDEYVLVTGKNHYFYLPNLKAAQLSPHLGKTVRVKGVEALSGNAIIVNTAEVMIGGEWYAFHSPKIAREADLRLRRMLPVPAPKR
jgi:hypothetical protein